MRIARCILDGVTYNSSDFRHTASFTISKRSLVCTECGVSAFFRNQGRDGREACFFAKHTEDCNLSTLVHAITSTGGSNGESDAFTTGERIIVNFNVGATEIDPETRPNAGAADQGEHIVQQGGGTAPRNFMHRGLRSLLRSLTGSDDFRSSTQSIEVDGQGKFDVADFFMDFASVSDELVGSYHGFWGLITDTQIRRDSLWLNTGGPGTMSVLLPENIIDETVLRFGVESPNDLAGAHILVFGELKMARNGKLFVQIEDPSRFTLRLAR
jgi:hypothetical protein